MSWANFKPFLFTAVEAFFAPQEKSKVRNKSRDKVGRHSSQFSKEKLVYPVITGPMNSEIH